MTTSHNINDGIDFLNILMAALWFTFGTIRTVASYPSIFTLAKDTLDAHVPTTTDKMYLMPKFSKNIT